MMRVNTLLIVEEKPLLEKIIKLDFSLSSDIAMKGLVIEDPGVYLPYEWRPLQKYL